MQLLRDAFEKGNYILDLDASDYQSIVDQSLKFLQEKGKLNPEQRQTVEQALLVRESARAIAIGRSVGVPHSYLDVLNESIVLYVRLARPLNLGGPDGTLTRHLIFLLGPEAVASRHLDTLAYVARLRADDEIRVDLGEARDQATLLRVIDRFIERSSEEPPREPTVSEGLQYTGRLCGGLINDIRRRLPHYLSDFKDGLHSKSLASIMFLFFACLAPAITFGGLMGLQTGGNIGAFEMILATAICGTIFALFSGQPLIILGGTGPLLVFTVILYTLCVDRGIPFLPTYAWVGIWTAGFTILLAITDASALMRYFTRFTDEIFAALISVIFIYEALKNVFGAFNGDVNSYAPALLSLVLAFGTYYIALNLQAMRRSRYLQPIAREFLADFGPTIALIAMTVVAAYFTSRPNPVDLKQLNAPPSISLKVINPLEAPKWVWFAASIPALLATVLVYLDQNITARIINSPDHKLKKGEAYHLDLGVVGALIALCSMLGLPWLVAATVRSLNHLRSLATVEEEIDSKGNRHDRIVHVRENRVTGLVIHLMVALSLLFLSVLQLIPMAVLYGLFLYMGVVSMRGNQFFERLSLWVMDSQLYPSTHYIRKVPMGVIHLFTLLQLVCLAVLWAVKVSALGILFPLFIAVLVPVRLIANRFFKAEHLEALDSEEIPEEEEERRTE